MTKLSKKAVNIFIYMFLVPLCFWLCYTLQHPQISVVMAVYNSEKYLDEMIQGVLNQSFTDFEFIIVNDASTDNSLAIINKYAQRDKRIQVYSNEKNSGAAATRNEGLKHVRGKYTLVIDSDDVLLPEALKKSYMRAEQDNLDVFIFQAFQYYEEERIMRQLYQVNSRYIRTQRLWIFPPERIMGSLFQFTMLYGWNKFIRTDLLKKNNIWFQKHRYYDDSYFTVMALLKAKRIGYTWENLYLYRYERKGSQTDRISNNEKLHGKIAVATSLREEFKKMKLPDGIYISMFFWLRERYNRNVDEENYLLAEQFIEETELKYMHANYFR
ncbi:MAG: glycosyltransferase family 2 protein [Alphaproteobacteria bacterium]|nr:glycosyltransferase family 2 protein [Alphaproteobacteria bacterium]